VENGKESPELFGGVTWLIAGRKKPVALSKEKKNDRMARQKTGTGVVGSTGNLSPGSRWLLVAARKGVTNECQWCLFGGGWKIRRKLGPRAQMGPPIRGARQEKKGGNGEEGGIGVERIQAVTGQSLE